MRWQVKREYPDSPIAGVAGLVFHEGKVLLVRRGNKPSKGRWGIPGGVVELGERVEDAVIREVVEETSIQVKPVKLLEVFSSIRRDDDGSVKYHYVLVELLCEYIKGDIEASTDVSEVGWFSLKELYTLNMSDWTRDFIIKVVEQDDILI
jgi:ADP-ribose pyrophosphatase YjhB (NUDIX family)